MIAKIEKDLENPKTLDEILKQSVRDVESKLCRLLTVEDIELIIGF